MANEPSFDLFQRQALIQLQLQNLLAADHPQRQGQRKHQTWFGMESLSDVIRKGCAAQYAFEAAHQIMMAHQAEVAGLAESDSDFVANHACKGPWADDARRRRLEPAHARRLKPAATERRERQA